MSKYYLVASFFDGSNFYDEVTISSLSGIKLDKLNTIDLFTASHSLIELFSLIESELHLTGKNQLSIKCLKARDATPNYYQIIVEDKDYLESIFDMKEIIYQSMNKKRTSLSIRKDSNLFQREKQILVDILNTKNLDLFRQIYPYQTSFSFLVYRYCKTDYDDIQVLENDYQMIMNEFSSYKTFRYWYLLRKKVQKQKSDFIFSKNNNVINMKNNNNSKNKREVPSIQECEQEFENDFYLKNHLSFEEYQAIQYNLAHLEEGKEEYLDVEEFEEMYNHHRKY